LEAIIERTKGDGGFAVVEGVYEIDRERLKLSCVAKTGYWGVLGGICKMNPKMKIENFNPWK